MMPARFTLAADFAPAGAAALAPASGPLGIAPSAAVARGGQALGGHGAGAALSLLVHAAMAAALLSAGLGRILPEPVEREGVEIIWTESQGSSGAEAQRAAQEPAPEAPPAPTAPREMAAAPAMPEPPAESVAAPPAPAPVELPPGEAMAQASPPPSPPPSPPLAPLPLPPSPIASAPAPVGQAMLPMLAAPEALLAALPPPLEAPETPEMPPEPALDATLPEAPPLPPPQRVPPPARRPAPPQQQAAPAPRPPQQRAEPTDLGVRLPYYFAGRTDPRPPPSGEGQQARCQAFVPESAYPASARVAGHAGRVGLRLRIANDGAVLDVAVEQSSGHPALDLAARRAAQRWVCQPARRGGRAVEATLRIGVNFAFRD